MKDDERKPPLTLEELPQRLNELQFHVFEKSAHIVVGLDGGTRTLEADALDNVGVQGTLQEPLNATLLLRAFQLLILSLLLNPRRLALEDVDEIVADYFAFLLGVFDVTKLLEE